jgi:transposase-like protein
MKLPICPHCEQKVRYSDSWVLRRYGVYVCPKCKKNSNSFLKSKIYQLAVNAVVISFVLAVVSLILVRKFMILPLIGVALPFVFYYFVSPFYVRLKT